MDSGTFLLVQLSISTIGVSCAWYVASRKERAQEGSSSEGASRNGLQHHSLKRKINLCSLKLYRVCVENCFLLSWNPSGLRSWSHFKLCPTEWMVASHRGTASLGSSSMFSELLQTY